MSVVNHPRRARLARHRGRSQAPDAGRTASSFQEAVALAGFLLVWTAATKALPFAREGMGLVFGLSALFLARRSLHLGVSLYALSFAFIPLFPGRLLGIPAFNVQNMMQVGLASLAFLEWATSKGPRSVGRGALKMMAVTYVWLVISAFMAVMEAGNTLGNGLDLWWNYILATLPMFFSAAVARQGRRESAFLLGALGVSIAILCAWAYIEYRIDLRGAARYVRMAGRFGQANNFGGMLSLVLPGFVAVAWEGAGRLRKIAGGMGCFLCGLCLLSTASRGSLLAAGLALLTLGMLRYRGLLLLTTAVVLLAGPYLLPEQVMERFDSAMESEVGEDGEIDNSTEIRKNMYLFAPEAFAENPVFGAGLGGFPAMARRLGRPELARSTHSWYIEVLTEMGIVGMLIFGGLTLAIVSGLLAGPRGKPGTLDGALTHVMLASTVALAVICLFQKPFLDSEFIVPPYALALGLALGRPEERAEKRGRRRA